jgi:aminopeptidase N
MFRTENAPQTKYLKDYKKPDFSIENIHLTFDIRAGVTTVTAKTVFKRDNPAATSLTLDGTCPEIGRAGWRCIGRQPLQQR